MCIFGFFGLVLKMTAPDTDSISWTRSFTKPGCDVSTLSSLAILEKFSKFIRKDAEQRLHRLVSEDRRRADHPKPVGAFGDIHGPQRHRRVFGP